MIEYLDKAGLKTLVKNLNKKVITSKSYENITATGGTQLSGSVFFFKLKNITNKDWVLRYRITESFSDSTSVQHAEIEIGGYNHDISYTKYSNIIEDKENLSSVSNIIAINKTTEDHLVGLNIMNSFSRGHNITIEIEYMYNCEIIFIEPPIQLESLDNFSITEINFQDNGSSKLQGILTIGNQIYDGTKDVTVPIYDGQ